MPENSQTEKKEQFNKLAQKKRASISVEFWFFLKRHSQILKFFYCLINSHKKSLLVRFLKLFILLIL